MTNGNGAGEWPLRRKDSVTGVSDPFPLVCKINLGYKCALAGPVLAPDTNKSRDIAFTMINISFYGRVTGAKYGAKRG